MPRVVSGFKKNKRASRSVFAVLFTAGKGIKRLLSYEIGTLPSWRKKTPVARPQTYLKRDIHKKRLGNPYNKEPWYLRAWQQVVVANRFGIAASILLLTIAAWLAIIFIQPTFYLTRVDVQGAQDISPEEISQLVKTHFSKRSLFLVSRSHRMFLGLDKLRGEISAHYDLELLRFEPDWTARTLTIFIKEKPSIFTYGIADKYFAVDKEGVIIRELPPDADKSSLPVIYEYEGGDLPSIGDAVLTPNFIASIIRLQEGFKAYPSILIHSFRLRISPQREITLVDEPPTLEDEKKAEQQQAVNDFEAAAESIAQAKTIDEKVKELQAAIENLSIEKLEEGKLDQLLKEQRVYAPKAGFAYKELEIYTQQGWSIKVGHDVFEDATNADKILNIFATLSGAVDFSEVREYVDLRIPNRVYYR